MRIISLLMFTLFMSGCATGMYQSTAWNAPNAESDWDVDSALCEKRAAERELTPAEDEEVKAIQGLAKTTSDLNSMTAQMGGMGTSYTSLLDLSSGLLIGLMPSQVATGVKDSEFLNCMTGRGWEQIK